MSEQTALKTDLVAAQPRLSLGASLAHLPAALLSVDGISLAIMWLSIGVARWLPHLIADPDKTDAAVSIVALPLLVVLPHQIGVLARPRLRLLFDGASGRLSAAETYMVTWLAGLWMLVLGLTVLTGVFGLHSADSTVVALVVATIASVYSAWQSDRIELPKSWLASWPILATFLLVSVPLVLIRLNQAYPIQVGWGLFNYQYRILQFVNDDHIALVAGLHTPIHAGLLGATVLATGGSSTGIIWSEPLLQFYVYGFGVYLFARALLKNDALSVLALWVAMWVLSLTIFQHLHAAGMRGVILSVWPWMMLLMYRQLPVLEGQWRRQAGHIAVAFASVLAVVIVRSMFPSWLQVWALVALAVAFGTLLPLLPAAVRQSVGVFTLAGATLTFFHAVEGPMFFLLGAGFVIVLAWKPVTWQFRALFASAYALVVGFVLLQVADVITFSDPSMISRKLLGSDRADAIPLPFDTKMSLFKEGMTYPMMGILAYSALRSLIWPKPLHVASMAAIAVAMGVYFLPESGLHRVLGSSIPLIGVVVAIEVSSIAEWVMKLRWRDRALWVTGACALAAMIALTPTVTSSLRAQVGLPSKLGYPMAKRNSEFTSVLPQEYRAGQWIDNNIPAGWAIVSDPTTMFVMEGMTFHPQVIKTRRWVAASEYPQEDQDKLRSVYDLVFAANSDQEAVAGIQQLTAGHQGAVLILSNRTFMWLTNPDNLFPLGRPLEYEMERDAIRSFCGYADLTVCPYSFLESPAFSVLYNRDGIAILQPIP